MKKTLTELVGMCDRYVEHINKDDVSKSIVEDYTKAVWTITKNLGEDLVSNHIQLGVVNETLNIVQRNGIKLKEISTDWDSGAVKQCYHLIEYINRYERIADESITEVDQTAWKVNVGKLFELIVSQPSKSTELYMWLCYKTTQSGAKVLTEASSLLRKAYRLESDEEIENLYKQWYNKTPTQPSTNTVVLKRPLTSLTTLQEVLDNFEETEYKDDLKCAEGANEHNLQLWSLKELGAITDKEYKEGVKRLSDIRTQKFPLPKQRAKLEGILLSSSDEVDTVEETTTSSNEQTLTAMTNSVFHVYSEDEF